MSGDQFISWLLGTDFLLLTSNMVPVQPADAIRWCTLRTGRCAFLWKISFVSALSHFSKMTKFYRNVSSKMEFKKRQRKENKGDCSMLKWAPQISAQLQIQSKCPWTRGKHDQNTIHIVCTIKRHQFLKESIVFSQHSSLLKETLCDKEHAIFRVNSLESFIVIFPWHQITLEQRKVEWNIFEKWRIFF